MCLIKKKAEKDSLLKSFYGNAKVCSTMGNETRVNLRHLLEDIRDSYNMPIEEVIVTELIANALDSQASEIRFITEEDGSALICKDNGCGMRRSSLREYHNIAASDKERGKGIGFAGLGAKLSLLIADAVITETRAGYGSRAATTWRMTSGTRAPWKFIPCPGLVSSSRGTAVRVVLRDGKSPLGDPNFLIKTVRKQFFPLLSPEVHREFLKYFYKKGVAFYVNGRLLSFEEPVALTRRTFFVSLGGKNRRPIGFGSLVRSDGIIPEEESGLSVSTYGKVIKHGWEWIGMLPRSHTKIRGTIEIPGLAEILTTNKTDFLSDRASLKKYYRYRKAVQNAISPILQEWGEREEYRVAADRELKPLQQQIKSALQQMVGEFPELEPIMGTVYKRTGGTLTENIETKRQEYLRGASQEEVAVSAEPNHESETEKPRAAPIKTKEDELGTSLHRRKESGLKIVFEEATDSAALGRISEDTIFINSAHPAWKKAKQENLASYHVLSAVAWTLSEFLEPNRSPQDFVSRFLASWGNGGQQPLLLL